jgi:hypothetical protein
VDVNETLTMNEAVAKLLNPSEEEQVKEEELEQETLEEETQEVATEDEDTEVEDEVEEETEVETEEDEGDVEVGDSDEVEEESETPETTTESDLHTVKVDGEEYEVNLEELKKGYQLEKNYTKRVQKLQEESKELEGNLRQSIAGFQQAKAQADKQQQEQRAKLMEQEQAKLSEILPEWVSPEFQKSVVEYARGQGYDDDTLANLITARDVSVINKARLYDELVSKKATVKKKRQPIVKKKVKASAPPTAQTRKARAVKEQRQKLKSSGKVTDAANAILSLTS